jgi:hypothetical protein
MQTGMRHQRAIVGDQHVEVVRHEAGLLEEPRIDVLVVDVERLIFDANLGEQRRVFVFAENRQIRPLGTEILRSISM